MVKTQKFGHHRLNHLILHHDYVFYFFDLKIIQNVSILSPSLGTCTVKYWWTLLVEIKKWVISFSTTYKKCYPMISLFFPKNKKKWSKCMTWNFGFCEWAYTIWCLRFQKKMKRLRKKLGIDDPLSLLFSAKSISCWKTSNII